MKTKLIQLKQALRLFAFLGKLGADYDGGCYDLKKSKKIIQNKTELQFPYSFFKN